MKPNFKRTSPLISLFLTLHLFTYGGGVNSHLYVNSTATGSGDGSSWTNAMTNLQQAIDIAAVGDTIFVAAGTYLPTHLLGTDPVRSVTFYIAKDVALYGGFSGEPGTEGSTTDRNPQVHLTILSGDTGIPSNRSDNVFHVVYFDHVSDTTRLDGFIIADGSNFNGGGFDGTGAGIFNNAVVTRSNPVIVNCVIRDCSAQESGGGMANYAAEGGTGNPWLINCSFQNNDASGGGGIMNYTDTDGEAKPVLIGCKLQGNSARTADGGAISSIAHSAEASPRLVNCIVTGNYSPTSAAFQTFVTGTGAGKPEIINCAFSGNTSDAIRIVDLGSKSSIATIRNSIIFSNGGGVGISTNGATVDAAYSIIPFGFPGDHIIGLNPMFVSQPPVDSAHTEGDLHLQEGSPAIDAGRNEDVPTGIVYDLDGKARFVNVADGQTGIVDIGPYEFQPTITSTSGFLSDTDWQVSPNPASESIDIRLPEFISSGELRLMDMHGRMLYFQPLENGQFNSRIDVSALSPGTYLVYILVDGLQDVKKIVIQ